MADRPARDWNEADRFWRDNYSSRPYGRDRDYEEVRPAYRFGTESATRHRGRDWNEVEPDLRREWESYEHRGSNRSTWDEIKQAAKDGKICGLEGFGKKSEEKIASREAKRKRRYSASRAKNGPQKSDGSGS